MPVRKPWRFHDPIGNGTSGPETYILPVNPNEGGSPGFKKTINFQATSAPDGKTLMFEGRDEVQTLEFSGVILTEAQYNAFIYWWKKRHQIHITDDLGRQFWAYITMFDPKRERAHNYPWKHSYTAAATVVDWP